MDSKKQFFLIKGTHGIIVGDSGFPLRSYLLTPFLDPMTPAEERYNKAQILTRVRVECCLGILKNRFRCLIIPLRVMEHDTASNIITACMVLHNIGIINRDLYEPLPRGLIMQPGGPNGEVDNTVGINKRYEYVDTYFS